MNRAKLDVSRTPENHFITLAGRIVITHIVGTSPQLTEWNIKRLVSNLFGRPIDDQILVGGIAVRSATNAHTEAVGWTTFDSKMQGTHKTSRVPDVPSA